MNRYCAVCCSPGAPPTVQAEFDGTTIQIQSQPVDLRSACQDSDLAILNGGHGATSEFLLAGKPVLILPQTLEQQVTGERITEVGAGLLGSLRRPNQVQPAVQRLLAEPSFKASAAQISQRYRHENASDCISNLVDDMESLIAGK
jgi:UDP:flavonoid glycosyltransferase YjiC (YdhE family)